MRKGGVGGPMYIIIMFMALIFVAFFIYSFVMGELGFRESVENRVAIRHEMHTMESALKGAKIYMSTAGKYSFYQALYDVIRQGGFEEPGEGGTYNYWFDNSVDGLKPPEALDVLESIQTRTEKYINTYALYGYNFMKDYYVSIPKDYTVMFSVSIDDSKYDISATSSQTMITSKKQITGETITIEQNADFMDTIDIKYYSFYKSVDSTVDINEYLTLAMRELLSELESNVPTCSQSYGTSQSVIGDVDGGKFGTTVPEDWNSKNYVKKRIMEIELPGNNIKEIFSSSDVKVEMVYADALRVNPPNPDQDPCKHAILGIAKVTVTSSIRVPVINEDGMNFAPLQAVFMIKHIEKSDGMDDPGFQITPTDGMKIPESDVPDFVSFDTPSGTGVCTRIESMGDQGINYYYEHYGSTADEVSAQLVNIDFLGNAVEVHKKAKHAFECLVKDLKTCGESYDIRYVGTYNWRMNKPYNTERSKHSFGIAIDINPDTNLHCPFDEECNDQEILITDLPDCWVEAFKRYGFEWGGEWDNPDAMHFVWYGDPEADYSIVTSSGNMLEVCKSNNEYNAYIKEASEAFSAGGTPLSETLLRAIICQESKFDPKALSTESATGLIQIIPDTFNDLVSSSYCKKIVGETEWENIMNSPADTTLTGDDRRMDPRINLMAGACYFSLIYETKTAGMDETARLRCTLAGYNGGPGRIDSVISGYGEWGLHGCDPAQINLKETSDYVVKIMSYAGLS